MTIERMPPDGCVGRFAVVKLWPELKAAEDEVIARLKISARNCGLECIEILADGRFLDRPKTAITPRDADFVLHLHFDVPKQYDAFSFVALWNPIKFYHEWGYERCSRNLLTHDDFISCGSAAADDHVARLIRKSRNHLPPKFTLYHSVDRAMHPPGLGDGKLIYTGINWEALTGDRSRHYELLKQLDREGLLRIYGPKVFQKVKVWDGYQGYVGELPFDGVSIIDATAKAGVALVLSSPAHKASELMSNRLFESLAAGALIICDENEFAKRHFGDTLLYIDTRRPAEEVCKTICEHLSWAHANQDRALAMIGRAQEIFESKFTLNKSLRDLYLGLQERKTALLERQCQSQSAQIHVAMILLLPIYSKGALEQHVKNVLVQEFRNFSAVLLIDHRIRSDDLDEIKAHLAHCNVEIELRLTEFHVHDGAGKILSSRPLGRIIGDAIRRAGHADAVVFVAPNETIFSDHLRVLVCCLRRNPEQACAATAATLKGTGEPSKQVHDKIDFWQFDGMGRIGFDSTEAIGFARFMFRLSALPADFEIALPYLDRFALAALIGPAELECELPATVVIDTQEEFPCQPFDAAAAAQEIAVIRDYCPEAWPLSGQPAAASTANPNLTARLLGFVAHAFAMPQNTWLSVGRNDFAGTLLSEGWAHGEDWGRWGLGKRHIMDLPPELPADGDLIFLANTRSFLFPEAPTMSVEIFIGDKRLNEWKFTAAQSMGERWVVIPKEMVSRSHITRLEFRVDNPRMPWQAGDSDDKRPLGLGLTHFKCIPTSVRWDEAARKGKKPFPVDVEKIAENWIARLDGSWINVGTQSPASPLLFRGWSKPEDWGKWGIGDSHTLVLAVSEPRSSGFELVAEVNAFFGLGSGPQQVDLFVGGHAIGTWMITAEGWRERTVQVPAHLVRNGSLTEIEFRIAEPRCPARFGQSVDARYLGLAMKRFQVRPMEVTAAGSTSRESEHGASRPEGFRLQRESAS